MPLQTLQAFTRKKVRKDEVLRALCEHEKWFAPLSVAHAAMSGNTFECLSVWGAQSKVPADELYLFTDVASGERAARATSLGPYASPIVGASLFRHLPEGFAEVHVNHGSDSAWFAGGDWVELLRRWGDAVCLERVVTGKVKAELGPALLEFTGFTTLWTAKGVIATAPGAGGLKNPAMVFTAPDCADAALKAQKGLKRATSSGRQLFEGFAKLKVDGLVLNPSGPGPTKALDEPYCWGVISSLTRG